MANAKAKGIKVGRKPTTKEDIPAVFYKHYPAYTAKKMNLSELARVCKLSRPTVYKYLKLISWQGFHAHGKYGIMKLQEVSICP